MGMSVTQVDLLIVGGGIAGVGSALALASAGFDVHVLEKAPVFAEYGAGLQLAPNALRALDQLGVLDETLETAVFPECMRLLDIVTGQALKTVDLGAPFRQRFTYPYVLMHRGDLLAALVDGCRRSGRVTLTSSTEAIGVEDLGDAVVVRCANGMVYRAAGMIGADGLWSVTRKTLFTADEVKTAGYVAYRGTLPIAEVPFEASQTELLFWVGPEMHLVQYPVRGGETYNQVAVFKTTAGSPHSDDWGGPDELVAHFSKACDYVRTAVVQIGRDSRWPLVDRDPIVTWARNRIVLAGDAAHPMLQFLAQGAAQSLEDALALARWVKHYAPDYARAFVAFQNSRVLRTSRVQVTARFFEHFWHPAGTAADLRNEYLMDHPPDRYDEFDWLYGPNAGSY
jgi:2-polyprenyl-6-methoxyphenol hydroxylase-like FAD-dependent oxidoreductase